MKGGNKIGNEGFIMLGVVISFPLILISIIFDLEFLSDWTIGGIMVITFLWVAYNQIKIIIQGIVSDRIENRRNFLHQYLFVVPKWTIYLLIYTIPFILILGLFFYIGFETKFYTTYCLPLLGGFIGEVVWILLFTLLFCYIIYIVYQPFNRSFNKWK